MKTGDILIVDFPFTNLRQTKVRPVVVVTTTDDRYGDVVVALISSTLPETLSGREVLVQPSPVNGLKVASVIKVYRLATIERSKILSAAGRLPDEERQSFINAFHSLVQSE